MSRHIPRLYVDTALSIGLEISPDESQTHHLLHVLRTKEGDIVRLFNGTGGEFSARVCETGKRHISILVEGYIDSDQESPLDILLAQGIARGERMDFLIQKAVELGVQSIQPLHTEKSQRLPAARLDKKLAHWQAVARSAAEQAGRCQIPNVFAPMPLSGWLEKMTQQSPAQKKLLLDPVAVKGLQQQERADSLCLLIGPESGLSSQEISTATTRGFEGIRLGPRVLRTETAGLAAIAALQMLWGDFG